MSDWFVRRKSTIGVLAGVLLVTLVGLGPAQAAPQWRTPAVYKSWSSLGPVGAAEVEIRAPRRLRFKVNTSRRGQRLDYYWRFWCQSESGRVRGRERGGTWNSGQNKRKLFEPSLPFPNQNRVQCWAYLSTELTNGGNTGWMAGRIQTVRMPR